MFDKLKDKSQGLMNNNAVKSAVEKAKAFVSSDKGRKTINNVKDKVEDFVEDKTSGKGSFGFGKK